MESFEYFEKPKQIKKNAIKEINSAQKCLSYLSYNVFASPYFPDNWINIMCVYVLYIYIYIYIYI
jgi:hypothetical protein